MTIEMAHFDTDIYFNVEVNDSATRRGLVAVSLEGARKLDGKHVEGSWHSQIIFLTFAQAVQLEEALAAYSERVVKEEVAAHLDREQMRLEAEWSEQQSMETHVEGDE